ncbi:Cholesterol oxidase [Minicystis rosea]|nr:Cholesterol oxidase [Minicystis rosea]
MALPHAVVIGTGFGGAVASCRLAQAGFAVTVLERGRRYDGEAPGFPRGKPTEWLWSASRGLFDVRPVSEVQVVQSAGYGGGSLIYANVHLRAPAAVFEASWPDGYSREALDPYYDLVAYMLDIQPIDRSPRGVPPRTGRMTDAAAALDRGSELIRPPLAVNFASEPGPNRFGVHQRGCTHCGECIIGCPERAKNTLDLNYLALAERAGANMLTEHEALWIEPRRGVPGYHVIYRDHGQDQERALSADWVFVCAGALGSTELLLRSRARGALRRVSERLGERYSGNGDLLAFAFDTDPPVVPDAGPTITTALLYDRCGDGDGAWFLIEDGGFPRILWPLVAHIKPLPVGLQKCNGTSTPTVRSEVARELRAAAEAARPSAALFSDGFMDGAAVFLAMGRDLANGRMTLLADGSLDLKWDVPENLGIYSLEERLMRDLAAHLGGTFRANPFWRLLRQPVTVHSLGGCVMGDSAADGVTDAHGEVFGHPGLYVLDGAILPRATGVNPAHTIAAVAERNIESIIRRALGEPAWAPPERSRIVPFIDPLTAVSVPSPGTRPPDTPAIGLTFRERMNGSWERAESTAPAAPARCALRITIDDVDRFIADPAHVAILTGTIVIEGLTAPAGADIENGVWSPFVAGAPEQVIRYTLPFRSQDGVLLALRGTKTLRAAPGLRAWAENTTLAFIIGPEDDRTLVIGRGVLRDGLFGVLSLAASMRTTRADNAAVAQRAWLDFWSFYADNLRRIQRAA